MSDFWERSAAETAAWQDAVTAAQEFAESIDPIIWGWGDGYGGGVLNLVRKACLSVGLDSYEPPPPPRVRKALSRTKVKQVMERDFYRCCHCSTHIDLTVDHVIPVSKGGTNDLDNLRVLCRPCNSRKGNR